MCMAGGLVRTLSMDAVYNNVLIKNYIVNYEQGVSDLRCGYVTDEEVQQL